MKNNVFEKAFDYCKNILINFPESGHDWFHTLRVLQVAEKITQTERGDLTVIKLSALFHDIADSKFNDGNDEKGWQVAKAWMQENNVDDETTEKAVHIIKNISWHKGFEYDVVGFPELAIVQDADRLDAIGAIGIARAFNYGGFRNRPLYSVSKNDTHSTLSHFYDKLIHIKDNMHTVTGKIIAKERHQYLMNFIKTFEKEIATELNKWP